MDEQTIDKTRRSQDRSQTFLMFFETLGAERVLTVENFWIAENFQTNWTF